MTKISNLYTLTNYISANSSGNVVIAAPASGYALDVTGTGRFTGALTGTSITLSNSLNFTSIYGGNINGYDGTSLVPMNYSASQHQYYAGGTLKMMLLGNGNLLLGTTTDNGSKLQVTGTANITGALSGTSATFSTWLLANDGTRQIYVNPAADFGNGSLPTIQVASNHALQFATNNALRLTISSTGAATFSSSVAVGTNLSVGSATGGVSAPTNILMDSTYRTGGAAFDALKLYLYKSSTETYGLGLGDLADLQYWAGTTSTGTHRWFTSQTERMRITSSGNVGIGVTSTGDKLEVFSGASRAVQKFSTSTNGLYTTYASAAGAAGYIGNGQGILSSAIESDFAIRSEAALLFAAGGNTERMRITSDGILQFSTTSVVPTTNNIIHTYGPNGFMYIQGGSTGLALAGSGNRNNAIYVNSSSNIITFVADNAERMRIRADGNVGVGTTGSSTIRLIVCGSGSSGSAFSFVSADVGGNTLLGVRNDGLLISRGAYDFTTGGGANVNVDADGLVRRSTSSLKYKKNVETYSKGLNELMQMRAVSYNSKNENETQKYAGLIAEEVHELGLTEFVQYAKDGTPDALAYPNMVSLLVKSIQELKAELDTLKNK